jgi:hypothetical protein
VTLQSVEGLVRRLKHIEAKNNDYFRILLEVRPTHKNIMYDLQVVETEDGHTFVSSSAGTIDEAVWYAQERIPAALAAWGYKE